MPYRRTLIVTGEIYHVFNRSIAHQQIFSNQKEFHRILELIPFYSYHRPPLRFSHFNRLPQEQRVTFTNTLKKNQKKQIQILAFCIMPNHLHFLLKEVENHGIATFMRNIQNSYAKYFNTKNKRTGALFQSMFKAVRIETDEQLLHVARYIHLNPLTSYIIHQTNNLSNYLWSSYSDYISSRQSDTVSTAQILGFFSSVEKFKDFTINQAEYQRKLEQIKHLILE